eukprot:TRINITY_DN5785_c0_g1_i1.p1 TRINITY_DN5785_c0_g1~~TRINITY_DN5785_c0_g1_i1.p1  ORF type:complete len:334 (+),score=38.34 TRINITY_DN5785_c0_g1_i1:42-1004(+)
MGRSPRIQPAYTAARSPSPMRRYRGFSPDIVPRLKNVPAALAPKSHIGPPLIGTAPSSVQRQSLKSRNKAPIIITQRNNQKMGWTIRKTPRFLNLEAEKRRVADEEFAAAAAVDHYAAMRRIKPRRKSPPRRVFSASSSHILSKTATFVAKERAKHDELRHSRSGNPFVAGGSVGNLWNGNDIQNFSQTDLSNVSQRSIRSVSANAGGLGRRSPSMSMSMTMKSVTRGKSVTIPRTQSEEKSEAPQKSGTFSALDSSRKLKDILCLTDEEDDDEDTAPEPEYKSYTTCNGATHEEDSAPRLSRARSDFSDISVPGSVDGL